MCVSGKQVELYDGRIVDFVFQLKNSDYFNYQTFNRNRKRADMSHFRHLFTQFSRRLINKRGSHCEICNCDLEVVRGVVHHRNPSQYNNLSNEDWFLVLCASCHKKYHGIYRVRSIGPNTHIVTKDGCYRVEIRPNTFRTQLYEHSFTSKSEALLARDLFLEHGFRYFREDEHIYIQGGNRGFFVSVGDKSCHPYRETFVDLQSALTARDMYINYGVETRTSCRQIRRRQKPGWGIYAIKNSPGFYRVRVYNWVLKKTVYVVSRCSSFEEAVSRRDLYVRQNPDCAVKSG